RRPTARDPVLLTGATGLVGIELLARYLERTDRTVYALVRAKSARHADERMRETLESAFGTADRFAGRVRALAGDITRPGMGLDPAIAYDVGQAVTEIVHGAASVSFDMDLETSREVNVEGTRELLEFAEFCRRHGGLRRFTYISTAYVAGEHRGAFTEDDLDVGQRFRNAYEQSKFEAEQLVGGYRDRFPITVARPSIIVGDSVTGWTSSFNVLYWPTRALARGSYPVLPARRRSPVDVVSVDYVADAVFALTRSPDAAGGTYHLTASEDATSIGELLAIACEQLECKAPPLISPRLYRRVIAPLMGRLQPRRREFLRATATYVPYFAVRAHYDNARARRALGPDGILPAPLGDYYARLIDYALLARWGGRPLTRAEAAERVAGEATRAPQPATVVMT
ncbi:MAG: SDR family oxidoreductase, partial [Solirubrobacteraceae bacterium]